MNDQGSGNGPATTPPPSDPPTRRSPADLIELSRASSAAGTWGTGDLAAMWRHQLAASVKREVKALHDQADLSMETTFGHLLLRNPNPTGDHLRAVKDYAKSLERDPHKPLPNEIVWLLYLLAVCAGDVRCNTRISSTAADALEQWVRWALRQPWIDDGTRELIGIWKVSP